MNKEELLATFVSLKQSFENHDRLFSLKRAGMDGTFLKKIFDLDEKRILIISQRTIEEVKKDWRIYIYKLPNNLFSDELTEFEEVAQKFLQFMTFLQELESWQKNNE